MYSWEEQLDATTIDFQAAPNSEPGLGLGSPSQELSRSVVGALVGGSGSDPGRFGARE